MGEDNEIVRAAKKMIAEYGKVEALRMVRIHHGDQLRGSDPEPIGYSKGTVSALKRQPKRCRSAPLLHTLN
jgi:hypothetical protein